MDVASGNGSRNVEMCVEDTEIGRLIMLKTT